MKKTLAFILAVTLANFNIYSVSAKEVETIDIIHTTDIHGNAEAADGYLGYGKIAGYINSVREENENTLVLDSGDTYEGSNYSNISKGESVVPILKTIGYDAMTLGNHEFAYNSQIRNALIASAGIPVVSANITDDNGNLLYDEYIIKQEGDIKVGIFGLTTETTKTSMMKENVEGVQFADVKESAEKAVADLEKEGCDYIIALTHIGSNTTENEASIKLAEAVDGIDLMLDGHSHVVNEGTMCGDTLLVASGVYGSAFSRITVEFDENKEATETVKVITADESDSLPSDSEIDDIVAKYTEESNKFFDKVIATTDMTWAGEAAVSRTTPTPLGTLVAESYRYIADADIGIVNGGGVRATVKAGDVTNKDIYNVQPFNNTISGYYVTGSCIKATFKESLDAWGTGEFLQFSGLKAVYDSSTKEIKSLTMADGSPIEDNKKYKVATSSFVAENVDFPEMSASAEYICDYGIDYEIVLEYIGEKGMTPPTILIEDTAEKTSEESSTETSTETTTQKSGSSSGGGSSSHNASSVKENTEDDTKASENTETSETPQPQTSENTETQENTNTLPYIDVNTDDWFYDAVASVTSKGLFKGVSDNMFAPDSELTRAMLVTVLYRMENSPQVTDSSTFDDVVQGAYYENAVIWAENNNIVSGISPETFAPDKAVTKEQTAAILKRYTEYKNSDTTQEGDLSLYKDSDSISQWSENSVVWAVGAGILSGNNNDCLEPLKPVSRAEMASILDRYYN